MFLLSKDRYLDFRLTNAGAPITGVALSALSIFFTRNGVACTDSMSLTEVGNGRYYIKYTPSAEGHDYVEVDYALAGLTFAFPEDIVSSASILGPSNIVSLTDAYLSDNSLKITSVSDPQNWTLYVYDSAGWQQGSTETYDAVASTTLNSDGSWVTTPLSVSPGTYHFVIRNQSGSVVVIRANAQVASTNL